MVLENALGTVKGQSALQVQPICQFELAYVCACKCVYVEDECPFHATTRDLQCISGGIVVKNVFQKIPIPLKDDLIGGIFY